LDIIEFKTKTRETTGNGPARALRREGMFPAILYSRKTEPVKLSVDTVEFETAIKGCNIGQILFNIVIEGDEGAARTAMIKELQSHPVSRDLLHADFFEVEMDRKIKVKVPVVINGKSVGVEMGGIQQVVRRELEVLCLPLEIPESIEIDVTELGVGDSIHVEEIPLAGDVEIATEVNFTVVTILSPKVEEEEVEEEELEEGEEGEVEEGAEAEEGAKETPEGNA